MGRVVMLLLLQLVLTEQIGQNLILEYAAPVSELMDSLKATIQNTDLANEEEKNLMNKALSTAYVTSTVVRVPMCHPAIATCKDGVHFRSMDQVSRVFGYLELNNSSEKCFKYTLSYKVDENCRCADPINLSSDLYTMVVQNKKITWEISKHVETSCSNNTNKFVHSSEPKFHHTLRIELENADPDHLLVNVCANGIVPCKGEGKVWRTGSYDINIPVSIPGDETLRVNHIVTVRNHKCRCSELPQGEYKDFSRTLHDVEFTVETCGNRSLASIYNIADTLKNKTRDVSGCGVRIDPYPTITHEQKSTTDISPEIMLKLFEAIPLTSVASAFYPYSFFALFSAIYKLHNFCSFADTC